MILNPTSRATCVRTPRRTGLAVVELAVCLPVIVLILLGSIEVCNAIFLKQTATASAYEAAKICSGTGGTQLAATTRVSEVMAARGIENATVSFDPALETNWSRGTLVQVSVSIPASNNLGGVSMFYEGKTLTAAVVMVRQ